MPGYYGQAKKNMVSMGRLKLSKTNFNANALLLGVENPESGTILITNVVVDIKTAAEAACVLVVGLGDNATDNVLNANVNFISTNALNIGVAKGPPDAINYNCKVPAKGSANDSFILVGANVIANADSLVADVYIDYLVV